MEGIMRLRFLSRARRWAVLPTLVLAVASGTARAEEPKSGPLDLVGFWRKRVAPPCVAPCPCPAPQLVQPPPTQPLVPTQPSPTLPGTQPTTPTPEQPQQPPAPEPNAGQNFAATLGEQTAFAPNIIGDLLYGS